jgi:hypothetical protein
MHAIFLVCGWLLQSASRVRVRIVKNKQTNWLNKHFGLRELIKYIFWPAAGAIEVYGILILMHF